MRLTGLTSVCWLLCLATAASGDDAWLSSWNDTGPKTAILQFVKRVTTEGSPEFVEPAARVAVFDNDGTLWCERPYYIQLAYVVDRIKVMSKDHPEWSEQQPFKAVLENDFQAVAASGKQGLMRLLAVTHAGMTTDEFRERVREWGKTARHPHLERPYLQCTYQPMLELLDVLRAHQFQVYIVSGGGIEFLRVFAEELYGIPPEHVIGSSIETTYEERDGVPTLVRQPKIWFVDDKAGKPVAINQFIGRRPIMAFGNSDGDYEMLRYVTAGRGPRFGLIVHHTDDQREFAYDRNSHIGRLDKALTDAETYNWTVVDMKQDWKTVFATPENEARK